MYKTHQLLDVLVRCRAFELIYDSPELVADAFELINAVLPRHRHSVPHQSPWHTLEVCAIPALVLIICGAFLSKL